MAAKINLNRVKPATKRAKPYSIIHPSNTDIEIIEDEDEWSCLEPLWRFLNFLGISNCSISREEAARAILERPIRIMYRPTIVEVNLPSKTYE